MIVTIVVGLFLLGGECRAEKAYVTDSFKITLRTGPGTGHKIIEMLRSAEPVEVLETQEGWTKVRVLERDRDDLEGWVVERYLIRRQPWEMIARALQEETQITRKKLSELEGAHGEISGRERQLKRELKEKSETLRKVQAEYEELKKGASGYLKLREDFSTVSQALDSGERAIKKLTAENERLSSSQRNRWFATGALVLLCGIMLGLVVGKQQRKKRSSYY